MTGVQTCALPICNVVSHHGLVKIEPDETAERILKRVHRTLFRDKYIIIREFKNRYWGNDRRLLQTERMVNLNNERRQSERRKDSLKTLNAFQITFADQSLLSSKNV